MKIIIALLSLVSVSAFAVNVKDCPTRVKIVYSDFYVSKSLSFVYKELGGLDSLDAKKAKAVEEAYNNVVNSTEDLQSSFPILSKRNGRCVYGTEKGIEKVEIFSSRGRDQLYVQKHMGPSGILMRIYADFSSFEDMTFKSDNRRLALAVPRDSYTSYTAGGALVFVGKAKNFSAVTRK